MKRLIGYTAVLCLLALTVGCGGATSTGTLAYVSNSTGTGFTVFTVNTNGTLTASGISPLTTPAAPKVLQFSPNGKWAFFLDAAGANIYGFVRAGNGTFSGPINNSPLLVIGGHASSLVIAPNSTFLYVAIPDAVSGGELAVYSIDPATGSLGQVPDKTQNHGFAMQQLVMSPSGNVLYGLSPTQQTVVSWKLDSTTGGATQAATLPVGQLPSYMILSADGKFMYVLDHLATSLIGINQVDCSTLTIPNNSCSPDIFGYVVAADGTVQASNALAGSPFNENADANGIFPTNPVGGATSNDSRFLFVANQGSHNTSVFRIEATPGKPAGELAEILGSISNGVSTASPFDCGTGCTTPSFVAVPKANNAVYLLDTEPTGSFIFQFAIDQNTGRLRALSPASVSLGTGVNSTWITLR
jgi:6-phosphogluconolactonase (cycloisomerase 2 family)